ncbi:MAG: hypothetical protein SGBAC_011409 [Bacillariaceae sp.]
MTTKIFRKMRLGSRITHSKDDTCDASESTHDDLGLSNRHDAEAECISEIQDSFLKFGIKLPQEKVFRYARFYHYDAEDAIDRIREDNGNPCMNLKMKDLTHFGTNSIFPLPMIRTRKTKSEVIYMNLARFNPNDSDSFIDSLCYILNDLSQTVDQCRNGVTVIADMQDVTMENFSKEFCIKLMQALQGNMVPTHVESFLIVSPPPCFSKVFKWMKSKKVSKDFLRRVHQIHQEQLPQLLLGDYKMNLPEGLCKGCAIAAETCEDYMDLKIAQEKRKQ